MVWLLSWANRTKKVLALALFSMTGCNGGTADAGGEMATCSPPMDRDERAPVGKVTDLTAGENNFCALLEDGSARCWGDNSYEQIGNGSSEGGHSPTEVRNLAPVRRVVPGSHHVCALAMDGCVWCWGDGSHGQMGTGDFNGSALPVLVPGISNILDLSSYHLSSVTLSRTGDVLRWGTNGPKLVSGEPTRWTAAGAYQSVRTGWGYGCGLRYDGVMECWGRNDHGQLGQGDNLDRTASMAVRGLSNVTMFETGAASACAVTKASSLWCWGGNDAGQVGNGTTDDQLLPQKVAIEEVVQVSIYYNHACARTVAGELFCWGDNYFGEVNPVDEKRVLTPMQVPAMSEVRAVAAAYDSTCALEGDHDIYCWGHNGDGQLGNGSIGPGTSVPTQIDWGGAGQ